MTYTFISEHCSDLPISVCCRAMGVSTSGYYDWKAREAAGPTERHHEGGVAGVLRFDE